MASVLKSEAFDRIRASLEQTIRDVEDALPHDQERLLQKLDRIEFKKKARR